MANSYRYYISDLDQAKESNDADRLAAVEALLDEAEPMHKSLFKSSLNEFFDANPHLTGLHPGRDRLVRKTHVPSEEFVKTLSGIEKGLVDLQD
ncbi:MAG: hypothetical protein WCI05_18630, partial [Myxococcales bacterium]